MLNLLKFKPESGVASYKEIRTTRYADHLTNRSQDNLRRTKPGFGALRGAGKFIESRERVRVEPKRHGLGRRYFYNQAHSLKTVQEASTLLINVQGGCTSPSYCITPLMPYNNLSGAASRRFDRARLGCLGAALRTLTMVQNAFEPLPIDAEVAGGFAELVAEARRHRKATEDHGYVDRGYGSRA
jgi:hypothetical protein